MYNIKNRLRIAIHIACVFDISPLGAGGAVNKQLLIYLRANSLCFLASDRLRVRDRLRDRLRVRESKD